MSILITGAGGMVGSHMIDRFVGQGKGAEVVGTFYKPTIDLNDIKGKVILMECDVRYLGRVHEIIEARKPTRIFHLAAQSYPTVSWERPQETMEINATGTINVFEAIKMVRRNDPGYNPVVVVACSSAEYGASLTPENTPVVEDTTLLPLHPYGVSKVAQDLLSFQYWQSDGIRCIRARIFNTTGPRKVNDVTADFTMRAVMLEKGKGEALEVGNLETRRAITDVRDLVTALILLSEKGRWGEVYNISGERVYRIADLIPMIEAEIGRKLETRVNPKFLRPTDEPIIFGDSSRLKADTGWVQEYTLDQTVKDMIAYWRTKL
ncbi:MAG: NAD-dependent epimerase/dehydratase family protein [Bacteroidetes bacterium]|nr:NAD-dependent epimerase/dehydratase family protein [Bacteroidota bacterium]